MLSFSERNYAAGNNVGLADDSEFASLIQMPVFLHQVYPLPLFNTSSADQPASEHSGIQIFAEFKLEDNKRVGLILYLYTGLL